MLASFSATDGADIPTLNFAFAQYRTGGAVVAILRGIFEIAIKSSHLVSIIRARPWLFLHFSRIKQQFLKGWKIIVFCKIAMTMVASGNESVQNI